MFENWTASNRRAKHVWRLTGRGLRNSFSRSMTPEYVAVSRFRVRNGMSSEVADAFRQRPHMVDGPDGFLRLDVISLAEDGIPKGVKLDPAATQVRAFRYIAS